MDTAVAQLAVVEVGLLGPFAGQLCHPGDGLALLLALLDFLKEDVGRVGVAVQIVVNLLFHEVAHELVDTDPGERIGLPVTVLVGGHVKRAELDFRLALERGFNDVDGDSGDETVADVLDVHVLTVELLDGAGYVLLEGTLMRAALGGVLPVDKGVVFLAVLRGVGEGDFDVLTDEMDNRVKPRVGHVVVEQVHEAVPAHDAAAVVIDGKAGVEVSVVAEHRLDELGTVTVAHEERVVGFEEHIRAVLLRRVLLRVTDQLAALEDGGAFFPVAHAGRHEAGTQRVYRLRAHAVEADALFESLGVILSARVQHADRLHQFSQRYATAIVTH